MATTDVRLESESFFDDADDFDDGGWGLTELTWNLSELEVCNKDDNSSDSDNNNNTNNKPEMLDNGFLKAIIKHEARVLAQKEFLKDVKAARAENLLLTKIKNYRKFPREPCGNDLAKIINRCSVCKYDTAKNSKTARLHANCQSVVFCFLLQ